MKFHYNKTPHAKIPVWVLTDQNKEVWIRLDEPCTREERIMDLVNALNHLEYLIKEDQEAVYIRYNPGSHIYREK